MRTISNLRKFIELKTKIENLNKRYLTFSGDEISAEYAYSFLKAQGFNIDPGLEILARPVLDFKKDYDCAHKEVNNGNYDLCFDNFRQIVYECCHELGGYDILETSLNFYPGTIEDFCMSGEILTKEQFIKICEFLDISDLIDIMKWTEFYC